MIENINEIYLGDCLTLMKNIPDNYVRLVVTSPPYNVGGNNMNYRAKHKYKNDDDNKKDYYNWLKVRVEEMLRISETVFLNIQMLGKNKKDVLQLISDFKDNIKDIMVWTKKNPVPMAYDTGIMNAGFEFILILSKDRPETKKFKCANFKGNLSNVITTSVNSANPYAKLHKATFPEIIPEIIIKNFSYEGDIILDPFVGTGTTCYVSKKLGRNYIGIEINEEYLNIAVNRVSGFIRE